MTKDESHPVDGNGRREHDGVIELSNEFASVRIRRVELKNGTRLEISSPRMDYAIRLDPMELQSLTWQEKSVFSEFLSEPFGPAEREEYLETVAADTDGEDAE